MAYDSPGSFQNAIAATLTAASVSNLGVPNPNGSPTLLGYRSGSTNVLHLTPAPGGTTINSIDASGCSPGFEAMIVNESATDSLIFPHLGAGLPGNQFSNMQLGSVEISAGGAATCIWLFPPGASYGYWQFG
jgi:hypothetical protein